VRLENAHGLARLNEHRFVGLEFLERLDNLVETLPVARSLADAAIDNQILGPFGDLRVEVVHQHS
jgi:hypothetical protein